MHRHDLNQIAEYAQGILPDETTAAALVESCEVCRAEYETQATMVSILSGVSTASMTDIEKAGLHRDLWTELRRPTTDTAASGLSWKTWALGAAAAVFVVGGVAGVLSNFGGGSDAAETTLAVAADMDAEGSDGAESTDSEGEQGALAEEAPTATTAASELSASRFAAIAESVKSNERAFYDGATEDETSEQVDCLEQAGLSGHRALDGYEDETNLIVAVPAETEGDEFEVSFVDPDTCELVHVED